MTNISQEVIQRFAFKHNISHLKAVTLFQKLQEFLDEAAKQSSCPSKDVDDAWHEFILHTNDYAKFCEHRYGKMIHHVPTSSLDCESEEPKRKGCGSGIVNVECKSGCSSDCKSISRPRDG